MGQNTIQDTDKEEESRRDKALRHCQDQIDWYERNKELHRIRYQVAQIAIITFSGITPILILVLIHKTGIDF